MSHLLGGWHPFPLYCFLHHVVSPEDKKRFASYTRIVLLSLSNVLCCWEFISVLDVSFSFRPRTTGRPPVSTCRSRQLFKAHPVFHYDLWHDPKCDIVSLELIWWEFEFEEGTWLFCTQTPLETLLKMERGRVCEDALVYACILMFTNIIIHTHMIYFTMLGYLL